jgi:hypothetical protein
MLVEANAGRVEKMEKNRGGTNNLELMASASEQVPNRENRK